ncbi:MAG TPA: sigma factor, partial [Actinomycetota bacterium]|nr:sigma factor [Actinomycetota bacterium]
MIGMEGAEAATEVAPGLSFEQFFASGYARLLRAMYLLTGSIAEADDIAQESMARVYERWERVRRMQSPQGYVFRTALNLNRRRSWRCPWGSDKRWSSPNFWACPRTRREVASLQPSPDGFERTIEIARRRSKRRGVSAGLVAILVFGGTLVALWAALRPNSHQIVAGTGPTGRIAFVRSTGGHQDIVVMNADGTGLRKLTTNPTGADYLPAWSPDGLEIAFEGYRGGNKDIYVIP